MVKEVILTPRAIVDYEQIIKYLVDKWGIPIANDFIGRFEKITVLLVTNTAIFPFVDTIKQIQKCVLTKHNVLYFKETGDAIKILAIFDTRQNPEKLSSIF
jgi:plasmid stabilization system protein ParE